MNIQDINLFKLVKVIEKYPCLYNRRAESYRNEDLKRVAWNQICSKFAGYDVWVNMTRKDRLKYEKELRGRWERLKHRSEPHRKDRSKKKSSTRTTVVKDTTIDHVPSLSSGNDDSSFSDGFMRAMAELKRIQKQQSKADAVTESSPPIYFVSSDVYDDPITVYSADTVAAGTIDVPTTAAIFTNVAVTTTVVGTTKATTTTTLSTAVTTETSTIVTNSTTTPAHNATITTSTIGQPNATLTFAQANERGYFLIDDIFNHQTTVTSDRLTEDADKLFLLSLLPSMKRIPLHYKIDVQIRMLQTVKSFMEGHAFVARTTHQSAGVVEDHHKSDDENDS